MVPPSSSLEKRTEACGLAWISALYTDTIRKRFVLYTDHQSLNSLKTQPTPTGRLARWIDFFFFEEFDTDFWYIKGPRNVVADWLSRQDIDLDVASLRASSNDTTCSFDRALTISYMRTGHATNPVSVRQL